VFTQDTPRTSLQQESTPKMDKPVIITYNFTQPEGQIPGLRAVVIEMPQRTKATRNLVEIAF
jgi:hypothetical protein